MAKTKIDWADYTWNPISGCRHACPYCYARTMTKRFGALTEEDKNKIEKTSLSKIYGQPRKYDPDLYILKEKPHNPYPCGFEPTLHLYEEKIKELEKIKKPSSIFVCSMADMFGAWVPEEWIVRIFDICKTYPQHNYLFLTKNPERYLQLAHKGLLPVDRNFYYGTTVTRPNIPFFFSRFHNTFISIEPIMSDFPAWKDLSGLNWIIVGAETGNSKNKIIPEKAWIENLISASEANNIPIFLKSSLGGIVNNLGAYQQFPVGLNKNVI